MENNIDWRSFYEEANAIMGERLKEEVLSSGSINRKKDSKKTRVVDFNGLKVLIYQQSSSGSNYPLFHPVDTENKPMSPFAFAKKYIYNGFSETAEYAFGSKTAYKDALERHSTDTTSVKAKQSQPVNPPKIPTQPEKEQGPKDRVSAWCDSDIFDDQEAEYQKGERGKILRYFSEVRKINNEIWSLPEFINTYRTRVYRRPPQEDDDQWRTIKMTMFPHYVSMPDGKMRIGGFERIYDPKSIPPHYAKKKHSYKGIKTFWRTNKAFPSRATGSTKIFIAESVIDAISHFTLFHERNLAYIGFSGTPGEDSRMELLAMISGIKEKTGDYPGLIIGMDNDEAGRNHARKIFSWLPNEYNLTDQPTPGVNQVIPEIPPDGVKDWNELLVKVSSNEAVIKQDRAHLTKKKQEHRPQDRAINTQEETPSDDLAATFQD